VHGLARLGLGIVPFDTTPYAKMGSRIEQSILCRTNTGRGVFALNRALSLFARAHRYDAVWIDKGVWIYPETLAALRSDSRLRLAIHYTLDAQIFGNRSRHFLSAIPLYDLLVTTKPFEVEAYKTLGARETLLVLQGHGRQFVRTDDAERGGSLLRSEVCFIGQCERHYAGRLKSVSSKMSGLRVWGQRWPRYARFHPWAREVVRGDGLWGARYPLALRSTKIALGLLSKRIPETTTTRTFEIPATGTFMLAERNRDHLSLFEEGKEAEFFTSDEELCDKIDFYLANNGARETIARSGQERCIKSNYSEEHQLRRVLEQAAKLADVSLPFQLSA
jgi:spore maturation protein CgeB